MKAFEEKGYKIFDLFNKRWALVTARTMQDYNTCVVGWGMMGNIWDLPNKRSGKLQMSEIPAVMPGERRRCSSGSELGFPELTVNHLSANMGV